MSKIKQKTFDILKHLRWFYFPLLICFLEIAVHIFAYRDIDLNIIWVIGFSAGFGFLFTFLTTVFHRVVNVVLTYVFTFFITLVFEIQLVYFEIFNGFAPVSSIKLGAQAVTNFTGGLVEGITQSIWWILLLLVPFVLLCIFGIWLRPRMSRRKAFFWLPAALGVGILGCVLGTMALFFSGVPSLWRTLNSASTSTDTSIGYFGINMTVVQEVRWLMFSGNGQEQAQELSTAEYDETAQIDSNIDFKALYEKAGEDTKLKELTAALSNMPVSHKNKYTGLCKDYNLIAICAEAFSPEFIDPELTPTLYKLTNNGFVFENFYAGFPNTTTNGEYAFCMGLLPDLTRTKIESSFDLSATNYLPYCYGNLFKEDGKGAYAFHNYVAEFYYRNYTHTNMGYEFKAANSGLDIPITWPSSDRDMVEASLPDFINSKDPFVAYYMTFSGHYQYTQENAMSVKNWSEVEHLPNSDPVKAYIACNLELEKALTLLMEELEKAGKADNTMIVLTTDHFPYGLTDEEYAELSGREIKNIFDRLKNSFICYVPNMEPVKVDAYCSSIDILPTVLNLLGYTYDSRLMVGQDALDPDAQHIAVLADGSFAAEGVRYHASEMKYEYSEGSSVTREQAEELFLAAENRFGVSADILNNDYYSFAFDGKSGGTEIDNLTLAYKDVGIMSQAFVYYMLKNDLMEPEEETRFGLSSHASIAETLDVIYRIAGKPDIENAAFNPFTVSMEYSEALRWCLSVGIIRDDGHMPKNLSSRITIGQLALLIHRFALFCGVESDIDEDKTADIRERYPDMGEEILQATMFCKTNNLIPGNNDEEYVFYTWNLGAKRTAVASSLYRLCTYCLEEE
ncbi:MAG: LTA synthase family protein [Clostridia bacterium]|nr:LTA synthase family protein [Clostridia bacterium]